MVISITNHDVINVVRRFDADFHNSLAGRHGIEIEEIG